MAYRQSQVLLQQAATAGQSLPAGGGLFAAVSHFTNLNVTHGRGSYVYTDDGRKILDMTCGIGATSTGHCHPRVVEAIQQQASQFIHAQQNIFASHPSLTELVGKMKTICAPHLDKFFFCNSGSEAVDNAIKLARAATRRQNIIAFEGGFHGRTYGAMAVTSSKLVYRQGFGPLMPSTFIAPYPYCLHCGERSAAGGFNYHVEPFLPPWDEYGKRHCCMSPLEELEWLFKQQTAPHETAAMIIEPILGEGGFLSPPPGFFGALRRLCDRHGILLIADEVQAGVGRTGKWWGHEYFDEAQPDILIFAKGIASGFPFAGLAARKELTEDMAPGTMGGTYGANVMGCAAACATIDAIKDDDMLNNTIERGHQLMEGVVKLAKKFPIVDVRGRGLMVGIEFGIGQRRWADGSCDDAPAHAAHGTAAAITKAALKRDLLLITAGSRETLRFLPPLNISRDEVQEALDKLEIAMTDVFGSA